MAIKAGTYTVRDILAKANFDFDKKAAADYLNGQPDYRRVKVGGLGFDDLEELIHVPYTADELNITLDGKSEAKLEIELDEDQKKARRASFESAADANDKPTK